MSSNLFISLLLSTFLCIYVNANAEVTSLVVIKKLPIQCTDSENYDMTDCEKAQQLNKWVKDQEKMPDSQRALDAKLGDDLLVEKKLDIDWGYIR